MSNKYLLILMTSLFMITGLFAQQLPRKDSPLGHDFSLSYTLGYSFPNQEGYGNSDNWAPISYDEISAPSSLNTIGEDLGRSIGSSSGSPKIGISAKYTLTIPLSLGDHFLLRGGEISLENSLKLSPKRGSLNLDGQWSVFPFLSLKAGINGGTGWALGGMSSGLGQFSQSGEITDEGYNGLVYQHYYGAKLKIDLAAVLPGDNPWTHVLISFSPVLSYSAYTEASDEELWYNGGRPSYNSWTFYTSSFLGYEIPVGPIQMIGLSYITGSPQGEQRDRSPMDDRGWGSDFIQRTLQFRTVAPLNDHHILQLKMSWSNGVVYDEDTLFYNHIVNRQSTGDEYWMFDGIQIGHKILF